MRGERIACKLGRARVGDVSCYQTVARLLRWAVGNVVGRGSASSVDVDLQVE